MYTCIIKIKLFINIQLLINATTFYKIFQKKNSKFLINSTL
jgi:hypothetical protein